MKINTIKLGDEIIQRVNNAKLLGLHIDDELLWHTHISHVSRKLSSGKLHLVGFPLLKSYNTTRYCSVFELSQPGGVYISQYPPSLQYLQVLEPRPDGLGLQYL